jgi:2-polyprenyl-3-methyl-5-hydroxy-6-metoxy-1,4-benzoquinol methylase
MKVRDSWIGPTTVGQWSRSLPRGCAVLDLGCGHGVISRVLMDEGFEVYGVDASTRMIEAFRTRLPNAHAECSAVEDSEFFGRTFDGVFAWGLMFLLSPDVQVALIPRMARVLNSGGNLLFTAPTQVCAWQDALTGRESVSLGGYFKARVLFLMAKSRTKAVTTTTLHRSHRKADQKIVDCSPKTQAGATEQGPEHPSLQARQNLICTHTVR